MLAKNENEPEDEHQIKASFGVNVGPLFYHDLVRLARRGRSTLLRFVYGLFLLLALYAVYQQTFPHISFFSQPFEASATLRTSEMAQFSANFAIALIALQVVAVVVLTPAYLAGAIARSAPLSLATWLRFRNHNESN
jgi:hypothetical protein